MNIPKLSVKVVRVEKHEKELSDAERICPEDFPDKYLPELTKVVYLQEEGRFVITVERAGEFGLLYVKVRKYKQDKKTREEISIPLYMLAETVSELDSIAKHYGVTLRGNEKVLDKQSRL